MHFCCVHLAYGPAQCLAPQSGSQWHTITNWQLTICLAMCLTKYVIKIIPNRTESPAVPLESCCAVQSESWLYTQKYKCRTSGGGGGEPIRGAIAMHGHRELKNRYSCLECVTYLAGMPALLQHHFRLRTPQSFAAIWKDAFSTGQLHANKKVRFILLISSKFEQT